MANFRIDIDKCKNILIEQKKIADSIKEMYESLETISNNITMQGSGVVQLRQALKKIGEDLGAERMSTQQLKNSLEEILNLYSETERRIMGDDIGNGSQKSPLYNLKDKLDKLYASVFGFKKNCCYDGDPVNMCTGNFVYQKLDINIENAKPIKFERFYNSMNEKSGSLSQGWSHNFEIRIKKQGEDCIFYLGDGSEETFHYDKEYGYINENGGLNSLTETGDGYQYKTMTQRILSFSKDGKLLKECNPNGIQLIFEYSEERLVKVSSGEGDGLFFDYNQQGYLSSVKDHTDRKVKYIYHQNHLTEVVGIDGLSIQYAYNPDGKVSEVIEQNNEKAVCNEYDENGRVLKQSYPDGGIMKYEYKDQEKEICFTRQNGNKIVYLHDEKMRHVGTRYENGEERFIYNEQNKRIAVIDKVGNITRYTYDNRGNVTSVIDASGIKVMTATYDAANNLISWKGPCGERQRFHYDSKGNMCELEDGLNRKISFSYDEKGRVWKVQKPDKSILLLEYDKQGNIIKVTDELGYETDYGYDERSQVIWTKDPNGTYNRFFYDESGRITKVENAVGQTRTYTYTSTGKINKSVDFDGSVREWKYNKLDKVDEIINPNGYSTEIEYDLMWNVSRIKQPNSAYTEFRYDSLNRLAEIQNCIGHKIYYHYDQKDNIIRMEDEEGIGFDFEYDANNRQTVKIDTEKNRTCYTYNESGRITCITNAMNQKVTYEYDSEGQKIIETDELGNRKQFTYNELGKIESVDFGDGRTSRCEYFPGGLLKKVSLSNGKSITYEYDGNKNIICKRDQSGNEQTYCYNDLNQLIRVKNQKGKFKSFSYDFVGNVTSVTDEMSNTTNYTYTPNGKLNKVVNALGSIIEYKYDEMDELTDIIQRGNDLEVERAHTIYKRDILGRIQEIKDPLGLVEEFKYDRTGRMNYHKDKEGYVTTYEYTFKGDISEINYADGKRVELSYNSLNQLTQIKDHLGTTKLDRNVNGMIEKVVEPKGREIQYRFGSRGEKLGMVYPDGYEVSYNYDNYLRLVSMQAGEDIIRYDYDSLGQLSEKIYPNGIHSTYQYDELNNITQICHTNGEEVLDQFNYSYDEIGNKTRIEKYRQGNPEASGVYEYEYDELSQLTKVYRNQQLLREYEYDDFNNRITKSEDEKRIKYTYNPMNQLIGLEEIMETTEEVSKKEYRYDNRGNLIQKIEQEKIIADYTYNASNQLEESFDNIGRLTRYNYNGLRQRVGWENIMQKVEDIIDITQDHNNLLVRDKNGKRELFAYDDNVVSCQDEGEYYYLQDELGSPIRLMSADGSLEQVLNYDEFGSTSAEQVECYERQPYGYTGYQVDDQNCYYAQSRYYDPSIGRFIEKDVDQFIEVKNPGTLNQYLYCLGNPLKYTDPLGFSCSDTKPDDDDIEFDWDQMLKYFFDKDDPSSVVSSLLTVIEKSIKLGVELKLSDLINAVRPNNIGKGIWLKQISEKVKNIKGFGEKAAKVLGKLAYVTALIDGIMSAYESYGDGETVAHVVTDGVVDTGISGGTIYASALAGAAYGGIPGLLVGGGIYILTDAVEIKGHNIRYYVKEGVKIVEDKAVEVVSSVADFVVDKATNFIDGLVSVFN